MGLFLQEMPAVLGLNCSRPGGRGKHGLEIANRAKDIVTEQIQKERQGF